MPGGKGPGPSVKDPGHYEKLKRHFMEQGMSEDAAQEKAARISNAQHAKKMERRG